MQEERTNNYGLGEGGEPSERQITRHFSAEEVEAIVAGTVGRPEDSGSFSKRPPFSEKLVGKQLRLRFDNGVMLRYEFPEPHRLLWSGQGCSNREEFYEALDADDTVVMVHHMRHDTHPLECLTLFIDCESGLVTCAYNHLGNQYEAREVSRTFWFGAIETPGQPLPEKRHGFSDFLVGKTIRWAYFTDEPNMNHIYMSNCMSACAVLLPEKARGMGGAFPSRYVGLKDTLHIYSWVEEGGAGVHGLICIDFREAENDGKVSDVGCFFGINLRDQLEWFTYGGPGKLAPLGVINPLYSK